jgi:Family of unknown function (DUF5709)
MTEQPESVSEHIGTDASVDVTGESRDLESYHGYSVDDEDQPQDTGDSLADSDRGLLDPMDEGYSPPEKWSVAQGWGNTPLEEQLGESLDQRLAQEIPEPDPYEAAAGYGETDMENEVTEVGYARAGRLVADDEGTHEDIEPALVANDVGIDGAAASAEEAAVHIIEDADSSLDFVVDPADGPGTTQ